MTSAARKPDDLRLLHCGCRAVKAGPCSHAALLLQEKVYGPWRHCIHVSEQPSLPLCPREASPSC